MTEVVKPTEKELVLLLNQQNEKAFSYLYDRYAPLIYGILIRQVKSEQLASQILKATFINIFNECKNLDCVKQSLFSWLMSLSRKTAFSDFKVNIDLKSLLQNQKPKAENYLQQNRAFIDTHDSVTSFGNLNPTIG